MLLIAMVALTVTGAAAAIAGLLTAGAAMIASMKRPPRPPRPAGRHCGRPPGPTGPPPDALLRKTTIEVPTKPLELP